MEQKGNSFTKILFLTSVSECGFFLGIFENDFIAIQVPVKLTFHPYCSAQQGASCCSRFVVRLYVTSQKEWLQSACILCTWRGYPTIAAYIAWRADQVLYGSYPLDIYSDDNGLCVFAQVRTVGGEP